jgi:hypothetical protein
MILIQIVSMSIYEIFCTVNSKRGRKSSHPRSYAFFLILEG